MTHKTNSVGNEITCVMYGIQDVLLNDIGLLEKTLRECAEVEKFNVLKNSSHIFSPYGYTALLLITESHIAIHTYPEYSSLVFNIYSCRGPEDGYKSLEYFKNIFKPTRVEMRDNRVVIE